MEGNNSNDSVYLAVNLASPEPRVIDKYTEADRKLKRLLGFPRGYPLNWSKSSPLAFALMVEHGCWPYETSILGNKGPNDWLPAITIAQQMRILIMVADHPSKEAAVRFAIVQAVIAKLESGIKPDSPQAT